jgi:hypothetical protein
MNEKDKNIIAYRPSDMIYEGTGEAYAELTLKKPI